MNDDLLLNVAKERLISEKYPNFPDRKKAYFLNGQKAGISTYWLNDFHPYSLNVSAYISPQFSENQQQKLFLKIMKDLEQVASDYQKHAIITYDYAPQLVFNSLAQKSGFDLIRRTVEPKMPLTSALCKTTTTDNFTVLTLADFDNDSLQRASLARMSFADYQKSHLANPVGDISLADWSKTIFAEQLVNAPLALIKEGEIVAYCFSFEDRPDELTWSWMGANKPSLLYHLQQLQLAWAKESYTTLSGEFDSTDELATMTYRNYAFGLCPVYETFLKKLS